MLHVRVLMQIRFAIASIARAQCQYETIAERTILTQVHKIDHLIVGFG